MAELPPARVVRDGLRLGPPPREIPFALRVRLRIGGFTPQIIWWTLGILAWAMVIVIVNDPQAAAAKGEHVKAAGALGGTFVLLLPVVWLYSRDRWRALKLLRTGIETTGKVMRKYHQGSIKHRTYHAELEYTRDDGRVETAHIKDELPLDAIGDDATEALLYDPRGKLPATTLDHLPGAPQIDEQGRIVTRKPFYLHVLIGPLLCVSGVALLVRYAVTLPTP